MIRVLTPFSYTSENPKYRFLLLEDVVVHVGRDLGTHTFSDAQGIVRMSMCGQHWKIHAGYAWDGSSPKFRLFGRWVGTPDFEASRLASLLHDTGYQFLDCGCFPLRRREVDCLFGHTINRDGNHMLSAMVYAGAVWTFGGAHRALGTVLTKRQPCSCIFHDEPDAAFSPEDPAA